MVAAQGGETTKREKAQSVRTVRPSNYIVVVVVRLVVVLNSYQSNKSVVVVSQYPIEVVVR